jgi:hypothetical protein
MPVLTGDRIEKLFERRPPGGLPSARSLIFHLT